MTDHSSLENDVWGDYCPVCGGSSGDKANPGDGFVPARDTEGNGLPLYQYRGEWMCQQCVKLQKAKDESKLMSERYRQEEKTWAQLGFVSKMEDV